MSTSEMTSTSTSSMSSTSFSRPHRHHKKACPIREMKSPNPSSTFDTINLFKCSQCNETFEYKSSLIIHQLSHKRMTTCEICSKNVYQENLDEHMKEHPPKVSFICDFCSLPHDDKEVLQAHIERAHLQEHDVKPIIKIPESCSSIKITAKVPETAAIQDFDTEKLFEIKLNHAKPPTITPTDNKTSSMVKIVSAAGVKKEEEKFDFQITPYIPDTMPKAYHRTRRPPVASFMSKINPFGCYICGLSFEHQSSLMIHQLTHNRVEMLTYYCDLCPKTFKEKFSLEIHMNVTHRNVRLHKCNQCEFTTPKYYALKNHKFRHLKLVKCGICSNEFATQRALMDHRALVHLSIKNFPCEICGKCFRTMTYVKRHIKTTHAGATKFQCTYCDKSFATRGELNQHVGSLWKLGKCSTHVKDELYDFA